MPSNKKTVSVLTAFKDQGVKSGLDAIFKKVGEIGRIKIPTGPFKVAAGAVAAGTGALGAFSVVLRKVGNDVSDLNKKAKALGVGIGFLDEFERAGDSLDIGGRKIRAAIGSIRDAVLEFDRGGGGAAAATLARLNLSLRDARGELRPIDALLPEISDGLAAIADESDRISAAQELTGSRDPLLIGLITGGRDGLESARRSARAVGGIITQVQADVISRMNRAFSLVKLSIGARIRELVAFAAPLATEVLTRIAAGITIIPELTRRIVSLVRELFGQDSEAAKEASAHVRAVFEQAIYLVVEGVQTVAQVAGTVLVTAGIAIAENFVPRIFERLSQLAKLESVKLVQGILGQVADAFSVATLAGGGTLTLTLQRQFQQASDAIGGVAETIERSNLASRVEKTRTEFQRMGDVVRSIFHGVNEPDLFGPFKVALAGLGDALNKSIGFGDLFTDALRRISDAVGGTFGRGGELEERRNRFVEFFQGIRSAATRAADAIRTPFQVGQRVGATVVSSLTSSITGVVDALIDRTKSLSEALRSLASNLLSDLARVAAQMLVIRALSGIANAFAGGAFAPSPAAASAPGGVGPVLPFRRGAVVAGSILAVGTPSLAAVPRAAQGMVFNPRSGGQLAVLAEANKHEGAFPLARMSNGDLGVQARIESGGGGAFTFAPVVTVHVDASGAGDPRAVGAEMARQVESVLTDLISRDPRARARWNQSLGRGRS